MVVNQFWLWPPQHLPVFDKVWWWTTWPDQVTPIGCCKSRFLMSLEILTLTLTLDKSRDLLQAKRTVMLSNILKARGYPPVHKTLLPYIRMNQTQNPWQEDRSGLLPLSSSHEKQVRWVSHSKEKLKEKEAIAEEEDVAIERWRGRIPARFVNSRCQLSFSTPPNRWLHNTRQHHYPAFQETFVMCPSSLHPVPPSCQGSTGRRGEGLERTGGGSETFSCSLQARCWSGCTCKSPLFCREGGGVADPLKAGPQTQAKVGDLEAEGNAIFIGCSYPGLARAIGVASLVADKSSHNGGGRVQGTKGWFGEEGGVQRVVTRKLVPESYGEKDPVVLYSLAKCDCSFLFGG